AHYDTVPGSPGADDNASSLAVLLEVARVLSPMRGRLSPQFVAFSLEEQGFIGSTAYLEALEQQKTPIFGAVILECVGYTDMRPGSQRTPPGLPFTLPDRGDFIGLLGNAPAAPIKSAFEAAVDAAVPDLPKIGLLVPGNGEALPDARRSDHVPFWDKGYPAVMLTDTANFRNPHYHQASDRVETLDIPFIVKVAKAVAATVIHLAELEPVLTS
ncbi:MAG: M28 family peptidase, partial [Nitrospiria bacterium]